MQYKVTIDRFAGAMAVLCLPDGEQTVNWPKACLPPEAAEGDVLCLAISVDKEATAVAKTEADALLAAVLQQNQNKE